MLKQTIYLVIASVVLILSAAYLKPVLLTLLQAYSWLEGILKQVFSSGFAGETLTQSLPLLAWPILIAGLTSAVYWMVKRSQFAYFNGVLWGVWLVLSTLLIYKL